jgi:hypothetical protein
VEILPLNIRRQFPDQSEVAADAAGGPRAFRERFLSGKYTVCQRTNSAMLWIQN